MLHPICLDLAVFGYAGFEVLLVARAVNREWRRRCGADRAQLWAAVRPSREWVRRALDVGSLACLQFLSAAGLLSDADGQSAISAACNSGDLPKLRWFCWKISARASSLHYGLVTAIHRENLPIVKWIVCHYAFKRKSILGELGGMSYMLWMTARGLATLQWLTHHFALRLYDMWWSRVASYACGVGYLPTAQWVDRRFSPFGWSLHGTELLYAVEGACKIGHVEIVRWLVLHPTVDGACLIELAKIVHIEYPAIARQLVREGVLPQRAVARLRPLAKKAPPPEYED